MDKTASPRKLATIVALDVAGYAARTEADEARTTAEVSALRVTIDRIANVYGGRVFNTAGDGFMLEFGSSLAAVEAALELAEACEPRVRVGVHLGDVAVQSNGDLLGHCVNVAARLMVRSKPGSTLVSADVRRTIRGPLADRLVSQGRLHLDKMSEAIEAFALAEGVAVIRPDVVRPPRLPDRPSIAVLPFANLSMEPEQDYFVDGMMEEITTALSRVRSIFVIASASTQAFRTSPVDAEAVGRQLGVRYLLEGSVRRAGTRVRIAVKLIDAADGAQIWAERYDDTMDDVFELQDRVALSVAGVIEPTMREAEIRRAAKNPTANVDAYDLYLRAMNLVDTYERASIFAALELLDHALAMDPMFARAMSLAAYAHAQIVVTGWSDDTRHHRRRALELAGRAVQIAGDDADVLSWVAGTYLPLDEDIDTSIALIDRSIELNPGCAQAWLMSGWLRAAIGDAARAIDHFKMAMRLDPCSADRGYQIAGIALASFHLGKFGESASLLKEATQLQPTVSINFALLAACYAHLGRIDSAREAIARYRQLSTVDVRNRTTLFKRPEHRQSFLDGISLCIGQGEERARGAT